MNRTYVILAASLAVLGGAGVVASQGGEPARVTTLTTTPAVVPTPSGPPSLNLPTPTEEPSPTPTFSEEDLWKKEEEERLAKQAKKALPLDTVVDGVPVVPLPPSGVSAAEERKRASATYCRSTIRQMNTTARAITSMANGISSSLRYLDRAGSMRDYARSTVVVTGVISDAIGKQSRTAVDPKVLRATDGFVRLLDGFTATTRSARSFDDFEGVLDDMGGVLEAMPKVAQSCAKWTPEDVTEFLL